tara:strand:- start:162 stop:389 length:228 start_codon:yes stop_codon:yes gene_type:complete
LTQLALGAVVFIVGFIALGAFASLCVKRPRLGRIVGAGVAASLLIFLVGAILTGQFLKATPRDSVETGCGYAAGC